MRKRNLVIGGPGLINVSSLQMMHLSCSFEADLY